MMLVYRHLLYTPEAKVLERSPDREASASNLHRLQHAGISELVQNHCLVKLVGHLERKNEEQRLNDVSVLKFVITSTCMLKTISLLLLTAATQWDPIMQHRV